MKNLIKPAIALLCILSSSILIFEACDPKRSDDKVIPTSSAPLATFFQKYGPQKQAFTINTSSLPKTITLAGGSKITFQPNTFCVNGAAVNGDVTVEVTEVLKRSDVILSGTNTNSFDGNVLESYGFLKVDAMYNGKSVDQNLCSNMIVQIPTQRTGLTELFEGAVNDQTKQFVWTAVKREVPPVPDSTKVYYKFDWGKLGWFNCDNFYLISGPKTTVKLTLANNPGEFVKDAGAQGQTVALFCAKGANSVVNLYTVVSPNTVKSYDFSMPLGMEGRFLAFCIKDGKCYFAKKDVTITTDEAETLNMQEMAESAIQSEITALNSY